MFDYFRVQNYFLQLPSISQTLNLFEKYLLFRVKISDEKQHFLWNDLIYFMPVDIKLQEIDLSRFDLTERIRYVY